MTNSSPYLTLKEFLQHAIQFEHESAQFYHELINAAENENVKEILNLLIKEENSHAKMLEHLEISGQDLIQFPPQLSLAMPLVDVSSLQMEELLNIALEREKKSAEVYTNSARIVKGKMRELLNGLATFEEKHVEKILRMKSYL